MSVINANNDTILSHKHTLDKMKKKHPKHTEVNDVWIISCLWAVFYFTFGKQWHVAWIVRKDNIGLNFIFGVDVNMGVQVQSQKKHHRRD